MFKGIGWFAGIVALALVVIAPTLSPGDQGKKPKAGKVEGVLTGVADNGVIIRDRTGTSVSLAVTASTKVELNERKVSVTSLPVGAQAEAVFDPATMIASKIEAKN